jgi:hypothetical protein
MKRWALLCFSGCMTAVIVACSGPGTAASSGPSHGASPSPATSPLSSPAATATATQNAGSPPATPPVTAPAGNTTAAVATKYYRAVAAQSYRLAFTYLAANATGPDGRRLTLRAFLELAHAMDGELGPVTGFSVGAYQSLIVMTINRKRGGVYHAHLQMAHAGDGWTIISIDRI